MSDPTYRIDVGYDVSTDTRFKWDARIIRLSDEQEVALVYDETPEAAQAKARAAIGELQDLIPKGYSVYVDDDGRPVEGHSVKA